MALDSVNESLYRTRLKTFESRWGDALKRWTQRAAPLKGKRAVAYHKDWAYLYDWLSLKDAGTLEPKPGLPPTAAHLTDLKARLKSEPASFIILTPYQDVRPAKWLSEQTGARVVVLPYTVGGGHAKDLFSLFDETLAQLLAGTAP
jgi:zinc/manganese transport system substrate-binding protein